MIGFLFLLCLGSVLSLVTAAVAGVGYRGLYFAGAITAFVMASLTVSLTSSDAAAALIVDEAERRGAEFINTVGPPLAFWLYAVTLGGFIGGSAFRARGAAPMPPPETAEERQRRRAADRERTWNTLEVLGIVVALCLLLYLIILWRQA